MLLPTILAVGCASASSEQDVEMAALVWYGSQLCHQQGFMDRDTAAKGMAHASRRIPASQNARVQAKVEEYKSSAGKPSQQQCDTLGLRIAEMDARHALRAQSAAAPLTLNSTTCSTYFGVTYCDHN